MGMKDGDRVFSAGAASLLKAHPELVQRYSKYLLARSPEHPWIRRNARFYTTEIATDTRGTAAVKMGNSTVPALEIVSWLFKEARAAATHHAGYAVYDAVVAVPPFFTQWERAALLQAADMAGLRVSSLVNEGTAAAIDYFVSRSIDEEPKLVLIYDVGEVSSKATLVRFERIPNEKDPKKNTPQAVVLDQSWDDSLGGRNFDATLTEHLLKHATKMSGLDIGSNPRAMEKLRAEAQRVKEVLSANSEIDARVESLVDEFNFQLKVTRAEFERMNGPLLSELLGPIKNILAANDLQVSNITEIQVIGGGVRVPKVRETIAAFFGRPDVDTNLNGDDAVCMGAAFYAAMKSTAFKKQNFKFRDLTLFPVSMSHPVIGSEPAGEHKMLYSFKNKLFSKKVVSFDTNEAFSIKLRYEVDAGPRRLPPGTQRELCKVDVSAPKVDNLNVTENSVPKVRVAFRLTSSGTVEVERVGARVEVWEQPPPPPTPKPTTTKKPTPKPSVIIPENATAEERAALEAEAKKAEEDAAAEATSTTEVEATTPPAVVLPNPIRVNKTLALEFTVTWTGVRDYTAVELAEMRNHTRMLEDAEDEKRRKAEAVNDLEAFVYATRDRLTDDDIERHASAEEKADLSAKLDAAGDYVEGDDIDSDATSVVRNRLFEIKDIWRKIERRVKTWGSLPDAFAKCRKLLQKTERSLDNVTETRMVTQAELDEVLEKLNSTRVYLDEKEAEWKKQAESQDPVVVPTEIQMQCDVAKGRARRLIYAPKRKKSTETSATTEEPADAQAETETPGEEKQDL